MEVRDFDGQIYDAELVSREDAPYLEYRYEGIIKKYNPNYGDTRMCVCGHTYARHFDSFEDMEPVGCKYCGCTNLVELVVENNNLSLDDKIKKANENITELVEQLVDNTKASMRGLCVSRDGCNKKNQDMTCEECRDEYYEEWKQRLLSKNLID